MAAGKRGPRSAADLSVVRVVADARIACPDHLTEPQQAEWRLIVNSLPADYFRPADVPLLGAFCAASALYKEALAMIQAEGIVIDMGSRRAAHPAKDILTSQASAMAQMAVKLRLCPSARYTEKTAATKSNGAMGKRPWEFTGTEDE
jgi:P27 family predicted phage terminase small subunit